MNTSNSPVGEVTAGVVGAAVGATAAVILSDPKRRKSISKTVGKAVARSKKVLVVTKDKAKLEKKRIEKQVSHAPKKVKMLKGALQKGMKKKTSRLKKMNPAK